MKLILVYLVSFSKFSRFNEIINIFYLETVFQIFLTSTVIWKQKVLRGSEIV